MRTIRKRRDTAGVLFYIAFAVLGGSLVAGCGTTSSQQDLAKTDTHRIPNMPAKLGGNWAEERVETALQLADQRRFGAARSVLEDLRQVQPRNSDSRAAVSGALALVALRQGDLGAFESYARPVASGSKYTEVDADLVEIVTLFRALNDQDYPVNAPRRMQRVLNDMLDKDEE